MSAAAHGLWEVARRPLIVVMILLEPLVRALFGLAIVLGVLTAIVFEISAVGPHFPFLDMLAGLAGISLALLAYYGLLWLVMR